MPKYLVPVVIELFIAFCACIFLMWVIVFRLPGHLASPGYKFIFLAKICFAILCGSGVYLILWPMPQRTAITITWFSILSIGCVCSALGFYLYSRDVNYTLKSPAYTAPLPAKPAEERNGVHKT